MVHKRLLSIFLILIIIIALSMFFGVHEGFANAKGKANAKGTRNIRKRTPPCKCPKGYILGRDSKSKKPTCYTPCPAPQVGIQGKCYTQQPTTPNPNISIGGKPMPRCPKGFVLNKKDNMCKKYTFVAERKSVAPQCPK